MILDPEARCRITELLVTECGHCKGMRSVEEQCREEMGRRSSFRAQWPGRCAACGEDFDAGESIRSDGHGGYVGGGCCG